MDPKSATLDWYYQVLPHDVFDLDNQLTPILADIDGRKLVFTSGKHGIIVCLDRDSGELVWQVPVGTHENYDRTEFEEDEVVMVSPGTLGGVETQFAYSVQRNLLVCPVYELPSTYIATGFDPNTPFDFTTATGLLVALNGADGSVAWQVELASGPLAAVTITNDIVFSAGLDGVILAFSLDDGSEVFRYQATAGINAQAAVSGNYIYFPAGGPLIPSSATTSPPPEMATGVIALKLGGTVQASPEATGDATPEGEVEATPEDSGIDPTEDEATPAEGGAPVTIEMEDIACQPNTFTIPANTDVEVSFPNMGALPHNWSCEALGLATPDVAGGDSATLTINAAAGTYDFLCTIPGHADAGMVGVLTVE